MIRVLLVDDQELIRTGFRLVLEAEDDIEVIGEAGDGAQAIIEAVRLRPDVVLMDVRMPQLDGIEATARLTRELPDTGVLVLTTFDLDQYAFGALEAGASGFLLKDARRDELVSAIRAVAHGDAALAPRVTKELIRRLGPVAAERSSATSLTAELTERERDVFVAIGRGLTNAEIAQELFLSESTVKTHVGAILRKLDLRDRVQIVVFAHQHRLG